MVEEVQELVSFDEYEEHWEAAGQWLKENAPDNVLSVVRYLGQRSVYGAKLIVAVDKLVKEGKLEIHDA